MKRPINCLVCHKVLVGNYGLFRCPSNCCNILSTDNYNNGIYEIVEFIDINLTVAQQTPNLIFTWNVRNKKCFVWDPITMRKTVLPWIDIPESIDLDKFWNKIKLWITFS